MILGLAFMSCDCQNDKFDNYISQLNETWSIKLSVPEKRITTFAEDSFCVFTFGDMLDDLPTLPVFEGGPVFSLSRHCKVVLSDINNRPKHRPENFTYTTPSAVSWMLSNCDVPWAMWYINNAGGVITDNPKVLSVDQQAALRLEVESLRQKYERVLENCSLTQVANCDKIFIVRIPHLDKIGINKFIPPSPFETLEAELKTKAVECYGVEFYKHSLIEPFKMLFFIDGETNIDKCVSKMARCLKFS